MKLPRVGLTIGDPAGVGPETMIKLLVEPDVVQKCRPVVIGNLSVLERAARYVGQNVSFQVVDRPDAETEDGAIPLLEVGGETSAEAYPVGEITAASGKASFDYVELGVQLLKEGKFDALTTAPVSKEAIAEAGIQFQGHLEYLVEQTDTKEYAPLLCAGKSLRVVHLSSHYSLLDAYELVTKENLLSKMRLVHDTAGYLGFSNPTIAVAAMNPHAGEGGLLGREEIEIISPAVEAAQAEGINASGPYPADTVFLRAANGEFDFALALFHDQGHIAIKMHDFSHSYGVSLGPTVIRTSVDHGTAFDIAGKGTADHQGLRAALLAAVDMVQRRWESGQKNSA